MAKYSSNMLAGIFGMSERGMISHLNELIDDSMLIEYKGRYQVTDSGLEHAEIAQNCPKMVVNTRQWKEEALTGVRVERSKKSHFPVSERSEIDNAVIPKGC